MLNFIKIITPALLILLFNWNVSVYAQGETSIRKQRREKLPVDKLVLFLESPEREKEMQRERVIDALGIKKGDSIADVGAGTGFFSFPLAARVGDEGRIYAVEIEDELLDYIAGKMKKEKVTNIIPVKSSDTGPNLPDASCDMILVINTYYYLPDPISFMKNTRQALKQDGLVTIISLDPEKVKAKKKSRKRLLLSGKGPTVSELIAQMERAGFVFRESYDFLATRFILVFSPVK